MSKVIKPCPVCKINEATTHKIFGLLPCNACLVRRRKENRLPDSPVEMTGDSIKQQRKEYAKSTLQPYRGGVLSKEYLEVYGTKGIKATPQEIKKAKRVWGDVYSDNTDLKKSK